MQSRMTGVVGDRAFYVLSALYLGGILTANATAAKLLNVWGLSVTTGALAIPLVYLTTDLINELYGPRVTRAVVWQGFIANVILAGLSQVFIYPPAASVGASQEAYTAIFATTPRIVLASMTAYVVSSLIDVAIFHTLRRATREKHFWLRKNGSTVVSQFIDSGLFVVVAFSWVLPWAALPGIILGQYVVKIVWAPLGTPLSYLMLKLAARKE